MLVLLNGIRFSNIFSLMGCFYEACSIDFILRECFCVLVSNIIILSNISLILTVMLRSEHLLRICLVQLVISCTGINRVLLVVYFDGFIMKNVYGVLLLMVCLNQLVLSHVRMQLIIGDLDNLVISINKMLLMVCFGTLAISRIFVSVYFFSKSLMSTGIQMKIGWFVNNYICKVFFRCIVEVGYVVHIDIFVRPDLTQYFTYKINNQLCQCISRLCFLLHQ